MARSLILCDHSTGDARIGAGLKAAGLVGVFRYAALGRPDVNITHGEVADLLAHDIQIAIVNEHSADYLLGGYQVGYHCALDAREIARAAGLPDGVVYMAGDSESLHASSSNLALVAAALQGAAAGVGRENVGYYGAFPVIEYLRRRLPWLQYFWQTVAWSAGRVHASASALQHARTADIEGVEVDLCERLQPDWGQRGIDPPDEPDNVSPVAITSAVNSSGRIEVFVEAEPAKPGECGEVFHTWQLPTGGWYGAEQGKRNAGWQPFGRPGA